MPKQPDQSSPPPPGADLFRNVSLCRALILAIALLLLTRNVTGPFTGSHDWNSSMYSHFARNHIQYGLGYTKLFCTWGDTRDAPPEAKRYLNHPPLIAIWAAIPMLVFGDDEWVGRLVPIVATLGSALLLMVMLGRLHSPTLGLLTGFFYVTLPAIAYFGRMLDHLAPMQFFSLLMLHGYMQWAGLYGTKYASSRGALFYVVGTVAGIGTGWAVLIMAGLIGVWHRIRVAAGQPGSMLLLWLTLIPGLSLIAVVLHIAWGCNWDFGMFMPLLYTRTLGPGDLTPITWASWGARQWEYMHGNFTFIGIAAVALCLVFIPTALRVARSDSPLRRSIPEPAALAPFALMALHGLTYVLVFRNRSWGHDYWQFLGAPCFALALAVLVATISTQVSQRWPKIGVLVFVGLLLAPMPAFARGLNAFHHKPPAFQQYTDVLIKLEQLVPPRVPVMTSWRLPEFRESFASYTNRWPYPQIAYYANRPLIYSVELTDILINKHGCAAYICELDSAAETQELVESLAEEHETVAVGRHHLIVLLNEPD